MLSNINAVAAKKASFGLKTCEEKEEDKTNIGS